METVFRVGTRGSKLALWQANHVCQLIANEFPQVRPEIVIIKTTGDKILDVSLSKIGDKGLFTKELERALADGEVDCCVHSMKDVPTELPKGMIINAVLKRADVRDALVAKPGDSLETLPAGSRVGTGSLRRKAQLRNLRPDLEYVELRGNLDTRLGRVSDGTLDAAILACAGIDRMGWSEQISQRIDAETMIPAPAQGAIGVEIRANDAAARAITAAINHDETKRCVEAERLVMGKLEGGCQVPIAAYAHIDGETMHLNALVSSLDGKTVVRTSQSGPVLFGPQLAQQAVDHLIEQGACTILNEAKAASAEPAPAETIVR